MSLQHANLFSLKSSKAKKEGDQKDTKRVQKPVIVMNLRQSLPLMVEVKNQILNREVHEM